MKHKPAIVGIIVVVLIVLVIVVVRNRRSREEIPPDGKPPVEDVEPDTAQAFFEKVNETLQAGDTNGVIDQLTAAYEAGRYDEATPRVLGGLISVLVNAGRVGEAEAKFIEAAGKDPATIRNALGMIYGHKFRSGDTAATFEWTKQLVELDLPEGSGERVFAWHLDACYRFGQRKRVRDLVPQCIEKYSPTQSANILKYVVNGLIGQKKFDSARGLITMIAEGGKTIPELGKLARVLSVNMALESGQWEDITDLLMKSAKEIDDRDLRQLFSRLCTKALAEDRSDIIDQLCDYLLTAHKDKPDTAREAARQWVALLKKYDKADDIPARFALLKKVGVTDDVRVKLYRDEFYYVLGKAKPEGIKAMVTLGNELNDTLAEGDEKDRHRVMLVDGCFMIEDYEGALVLLEAGINGRDAQWVEMAKDKVQAHLALKRGDVDTAVKFFRKFMGYVSTWDSAEVDPSTGIRHTKEMTLGYNAKRIGNIYKDAGRAPEAGTAYLEARKYYEKALEEAAEGSKARELIKTELASLPGRPGEEKPAPEKAEETPAAPIPEKPAVPETPATPGEPEMPETPAEEAVPEKAVEPEKPVEPETPGTPDTPKAVEKTE